LVDLLFKRSDALSRSQLVRRGFAILDLEHQLLSDSIGASSDFRNCELVRVLPVPFDREARFL
jgi:hypothetical protein